MQFVYHKNSGDESIDIDGNLFRHIFGSRREKKKSHIYLRNFETSVIYEYKIESISKKNALIVLVSSKSHEVEPDKFLHIALCMIEPKSIEKALPSLNEIGVSKITFIYCANSQKNYKPNIEKMKNILIESSQQCGRSSIIELDIVDGLEEFLNQNRDTHLLDFGGEYIKIDSNIKTILIGSEGGITKNERDLFDDNLIVGLKSDSILKSTTATICVASRILL
jgi:16S rRNA (uracil1498-N3)-methyltransferase